MNIYNQQNRVTIPLLFVGLPLLFIIIYCLTPSSTPPTFFAGHTASQTISGDCNLRQNNNSTRAQCTGSFTFSATATDGKTINTNVSGRDNTINIRSHGTGAATAQSSKISVSQSGNGSSVSITFTDTTGTTQLDQHWSLQN